MITQNRPPIFAILAIQAVVFGVLYLVMPSVSALAGLGILVFWQMRAQRIISAAVTKLQFWLGMGDRPIPCTTSGNPCVGVGAALIRYSKRLEKHGKRLEKHGEAAVRRIPTGHGAKCNNNANNPKHSRESRYFYAHVLRSRFLWKMVNKACVVLRSFERIAESVG